MIIEIILYIVLVLLIGASIYCYKKSKNPETYEDAIYLAGSIFAGVFAFFIFIGIMIGSSHDNTSKSEFSIVSLERQNEVYGSFFLGIGTIKEINYYYVYKKTSRGLNFEKIPIIGGNSAHHSKVYIVETNEISPRYVEETVCEEEPSMLNWFQGCDSTRKLIVPKGTIVREFRA